MNLLHVNATQVYKYSYGHGIQIQREPSAIPTIGISLERVPCGMLYLLLVSLWKEFLVGCCPLTLMQSEHEVCIAHKVEIILQTVENL